MCIRDSSPIGPGGSERRRSVSTPSSVMVATPMLATCSQGSVSFGSAAAAAAPSATSSASAGGAALERLVASLDRRRIDIDLLAHLPELRRHLRHAVLDHA